MEKQLFHINELCVKVTDGSHFSPVESVDGNYPMFSVKDMEYNGFSYENCKYIDLETYKVLERNDCRPLKNDILIAKDGSYLKCVFKVKEDMAVCILSSIAILRPNVKVIDPDYFVYLLRTKSIKSAMASYVSGSALPRIILSDFKKMKLNLFENINYQKLISNTLIKYDTLIENNNNRIKLLENIAEELYKEWFVRFRFPGYENVQFKNKIPVGWVYGKDHKYENIPVNWTYSEFREIGSFVRGRNITASEMVEGDVPVVSAGLEPSGYHNEYNVSGQSITISASGANAGYLSYHLQNIWAADCSYYENNKNLWFAYNTLKFLQPVITNMQVGSAQPHVYPKNINKICVIIPNEQKINLYEAKVKPLYEEIKLINQKNENLIKQRDALLPRLMSGKLSVEGKEII